MKMCMIRTTVAELLVTAGMLFSGVANADPTPSPAPSWGPLDKSVQLEACHDLAVGYSPDQVMGILEALTASLRHRHGHIVRNTPTD